MVELNEHRKIEEGELLVSTLVSESEETVEARKNYSRKDTKKRRLKILLHIGPARGTNKPWVRTIRVQGRRYWQLVQNVYEGQQKQDKGGLL